MYEINNEERKNDKLIIRCKPSTKWSFKRLVADMKARSYEEALLRLMNMYYSSRSREERIELY